VAPGVTNIILNGIHQEDPVSHLQQLVDKAVDLETQPEELATYAALWRLAPYLDDDAVAAAQLLVKD